VDARRRRATAFKDRAAGLILSNYLLVAPDACLCLPPGNAERSVEPLSSTGISRG
jgi:hypothetical protein